MRTSALYFFALLAGTVHAYQQYLRQGSQQQSSVAFGVSMQIRVSDQASDNVPTAQDYNGAVTAFQAWFHANSGASFEATRDYDLTYARSRCLLDEAATSYLPASADSFQHTIALSCRSIINADTNMISSKSLMREATNHYPLNDFITEYLFPMSPSNSPFKSTRNLKLSMLPPGGSNPVSTKAPVPTNAPGPTKAPVSKKTIPVIWNGTRQCKRKLSTGGRQLKQNATSSLPKATPTSILFLQSTTLRLTAPSLPILLVAFNPTSGPRPGIHRLIDLII